MPFVEQDGRRRSMACAFYRPVAPYRRTCERCPGWFTSSQPGTALERVKCECECMHPGERPKALPSKLDPPKYR